VQKKHKGRNRHCDEADTWVWEVEERGYEAGDNQKIDVVTFFGRKTVGILGGHGPRSSNEPEVRCSKNGAAEPEQTGR